MSSRRSLNPSPVELEVAQPALEVSRRLPGWRLWAPLLLQTALILAVPAQDAYTFVVGRQITLQTAPVDPYDLLRGYSQTLSYDISNPQSLAQLPGGAGFKQPQGKISDFYVILEAPSQGQTTPPQPWKPVQLSPDRPDQLSANQVALKGHYNGWSVTYGLENYYMPEDQRQQINTAIGQVRQQPEKFVVEVKVDGTGNAVPVSLWVEDHNYRF